MATENLRRCFLSFVTSNFIAVLIHGSANLGSHGFTAAVTDPHAQQHNKIPADQDIWTWHGSLTKSVISIANITCT